MSKYISRRVMLVRLSSSSTHYDYLGDRANGLIGTVAAEGNIRLNDIRRDGCLGLACPFILPDPLCASVLGVKEYLDETANHRGGGGTPFSSISMLGEYKLLDQEE